MPRGGGGALCADGINSMNNSLLSDAFTDCDDTINEVTKCLTCNENFEQDDDGIQCEYCLRWKHESCFKKPTYRQEKSKLMWTCSQFCKSKMPYDDKLLNVQEGEVTLKVLMQIMQGVFTEVRKTNKKIDGFEQQKRVTERIQKETAQNSADVKALKSEVARLKQLQINNKAICIGIANIEDPTNKTEMIKQCLNNQLESIGVQYNTEHYITNCYQLSANGRRKKCTTFLEFISNSERNRFITAIRSIKSNKQIKVYELLTPENNMIFNEAKEELKKYLFIYTKNGIVYGRKQRPPGSDAKYPAVQIISSEMIAQLKVEYAGSVSESSIANSQNA